MLLVLLLALLSLPVCLNYPAPPLWHHATLAPATAPRWRDLYMHLHMHPAPRRSKLRRRSHFLAMREAVRLHLRAAAADERARVEGGARVGILFARACGLPRVQGREAELHGHHEAHERSNMAGSARAT